jgi:hypothetical protein
VRNFLKLASGIAVSPLLLQVFSHPDIWDQENIRRTYSEDSPHKDVSDILVRFPEPDSADIGDTLICEWTPAVQFLPAAKELAFGLMAAYRGEVLGRVMVTRLAPGKQIKPHADVMGKYAAFFTRFHIPLQSDPGCVFSCGDEQVQMAPGEVYWFNGHLNHAVVNNSSRDRLNLIVDLHT